MCYFADILTVLRLLLAFVVPVCILQGEWSLALVLFGVAALSDALDGPCARRWPYSPQQVARLPWRRIDPHVLDNVPDALMVALATFALVLRVEYWWWIALAIYGVSGVFIVTVQVLIRAGRARTAEITDVVFGWWFVANIGMVVAEVAYRSGHLALVVGIAAVMALPLLWLKRNRAFTRPETREAALRHAK